MLMKVPIRAYSEVLPVGFITRRRIQPLQAVPFRCFAAPRAAEWQPLGGTPDSALEGLGQIDES